MKNSSKLLIICLILTVIMSDVILFEKDFTPAFADSVCAEIVIERETRRVLFESNSTVKVPMASTTKVATAITAIENCDIDKEVVIGKNTVGVEGSSIYLREGETLTVKELLYGLMLRSGNDAAVAIAEAVSGSVNSFTNLMNLTAQKIGAKNTNFTNPHGLHDDNHYTTAYDLALITAYALKNPIFSEIVACDRINVSNDYEDYDRVLINKNKMLHMFDGADGVKTGYTKKAGRCLVSSATRNGMQLICVVLNCVPMFERSCELLENAFARYKPLTLINKGESFSYIGVEDGYRDGDSIAVGTEQTVVIPVADDEIEKLDFATELPKTLPKNTKIGTSVGNLSVYLDKDLIFLGKLVTISCVNNYGFDDIVKKIASRWSVRKVFYEN